jgi:hypothetical protein
VFSCVWESFGKFPARTLKSIPILEKTQGFWEFPNVEAANLVLLSEALLG